MNLWTKQRSITHISHQMCCVALVKTWMWKDRREEPAWLYRQVVWVLSACSMTPIFPVPPSLTRTALVGCRGLRRSVAHLWASLNWTSGSQQQAVSVALSWLKWLADTGTCALTMPDERAAQRRRPLFWLSENPPLLSAEVNKRPNNTRVKAIESFFAKWSLIGPFFLVDQSYDFGGDSRLIHNSTFKSFSWKWTTWKKWPLPKLQLWGEKLSKKNKKIKDFHCWIAPIKWNT